MVDAERFTGPAMKLTWSLFHRSPALEPSEYSTLAERSFKGGEGEGNDCCRRGSGGGGK